MTILLRPRRGTKIVDVSNTGTEEDVGNSIAFCLRTKGYCLVGDACEKELLDNALDEVCCLDAEEKLEQPNELVQDGLLGSNGSARIWELPAPAEATVDAEALGKLDVVMLDLLKALSPYQGLAGLDCTSRSQAILHQTGDSFYGDCDLADNDADKWHTILIRQKVLVLLFLGPSAGSLELEPYDDDAIPIEINTYPGLVILLRTDQLKYSYTSNDTTSVLSCFFMQDNILRMKNESRQIHMTPAALALEEYVAERMQELKSAEDEGATYGEEIPRNWVLAMNHSYHNIDMTAVPAVAVKFPTTWNSSEFFQGVLISGCDVMTMVPFSRWDHEVIYNPSVDAPQMQPPKTNCMHASFIEGVELFDNKMFGLSPAEVKGMDPNQRLVLETSYEALLSGGITKKKMLNSSCGVYVGTSMSDWALADRTADVGTFGATGGAASITAGRLSFCLGLKGACLSIDTEAAASMTATLLASESVQDKGRGRVQEFALGIGTSLNLAKHFWPVWSAAGLLCRSGRTFTFDESSDGFVRSEGSGSIMVKLQKRKIDGEAVDTVLDDAPLGLLAGGWSNHNGMSASLTAPNASAMEEALLESAKQVRIQALDVDSIEVFGAGHLLADAIEAGCARKAYRYNNFDENLFITASKTMTGNGVEMSGIYQLVKAFHSTKRCLTPPNLHLRALNPHIDREDAAGFPDERLPFRMTTCYQSIFARGFGGSNVNLISFGEVDEALFKPPPPPEDFRHKLVYWPSGGGLLDFNSRPRDGYFISGTWNEWSSDQRMEEEGDGVYGCTITLDEKRWEQFQIMLDGDAARLLHPGNYQAPKGTTVLGPDDVGESIRGLTWFIDGRKRLPGFALTEGTGDGIVTTQELTPSEFKSDEALPGTQFRIRLHIAGKWRTVSWSKCGFAELQKTYGRYYVITDRGEWNMENAIELEDHGSGLFRAVVTQPSEPLQFVIIRDGDFSQAIFPNTSVSVAEEAQVIGPTDVEGTFWYLLRSVYPEGSRVTIELELSDLNPPAVRWS